jgi:hypothetical protein
MDTKLLLGRIYISPNALSQLKHSEILAALQRHASGDWGDLNHFDQQKNNLSLKKGLPIYSVYQSITNVKLWIVTNSSRSASFALLPEDYYTLPALFWGGFLFPKQWRVDSYVHFWLQSSSLFCCLSAMPGALQW